MCVMRTAVEFFCTFWPPCPPARKTSIRRSSGSMFTSDALSTSGITSARANDVWRDFEESNGEIRTSRCTPRSPFR